MSLIKNCPFGPQLFSFNYYESLLYGYYILSSSAWSLLQQQQQQQLNAAPRPAEGDTAPQRDTGPRMAQLQDFVLVAAFHCYEIGSLRTAELIL